MVKRGKGEPGWRGTVSGSWDRGRIVEGRIDEGVERQAVHAKLNRAGSLHQSQCKTCRDGPRIMNELSLLSDVD